MTLATRERRQVRVPLLLLSAAAWALLMVGPGGTAMSTHHSAMSAHSAMSTHSTMSTHHSATTPEEASSGAATSETRDPVLAQLPSVPLMTGWALMVTAMMFPLLTAPVHHIRVRSFSRRRARAIALFVMSYGTVWMAAGIALLTLSTVTQLVGFDSLVVASTVLCALMWQFSPAKQYCLNRMHAHPELAAFGPAADIDALRFGLTHAVWCVGSCWALMLLALMVPYGHIAAMAAVMLWLAAERLVRPMPPGWRLRGPDKAVRLAVAQVRTALRRVPQWE